MSYSELRSGKDLLNDLEEAKRVFLVGCPACANASLYIQKGAEGSAMLTLTPTGFRAISMIEEVDRLTHLLADKGSVVVTRPVCGLCEIHQGIRG